MTKSDHIISWLTGLTTLAMALLSFILSFNALTDLAGQYRVSIPPFIPLIIEGGVVVFSLNALWRSLHAIPARWQWTLIIGSSILAGVFNVVHAPTDTSTIAVVGLSINPAQVMAALPSLFLLLSFETFLSQIKHGVKFSKVSMTLENLEARLTQRQAEVDAVFSELDTAIAQRQNEVDVAFVQRQAEVDAVITKLNNSRQAAQNKLDRLLAEIEQRQTQLAELDKLRSERVQEADTVVTRRKQLLDILVSSGDIGVTSLAEQLNTSRNTVYNDFKALEQAGVIHRNGQGWKVG